MSTVASMTDRQNITTLLLLAYITRDRDPAPSEQQLTRLVRHCANTADVILSLGTSVKVIAEHKPADSIDWSRYPLPEPRVGVGQAGEWRGVQ